MAANESGRILVSTPSMPGIYQRGGIYQQTFIGTDFAGTAQKKTLIVMPKVPVTHLIVIRNVWALCMGSWAALTGLTSLGFAVGYHNSSFSAGSENGYLEFAPDGAKTVGLLASQRGTTMIDYHPHMIGIAPIGGDAETIGNSPIYVTVTADSGVGHTTDELAAAVGDTAKIAVYVEYTDVARP